MQRTSIAAMTALVIGLVWTSLPASASTTIRGRDVNVAAPALALAGKDLGLRQAPLRRGKSDVAYPPGGFKVEGSHGYSISVFVATRRSVMLSAFSGDRLAFYRAPATVDPRTGIIAARFGDLGSVSMSFKPTGGPPRVLNLCGKSGDKILFERGYFVGSFRFRGEGGYTAVGPVGKAPEYMGYFALGCPGFITSGSGGPGGPGAELDAHRKSNGGRIEFSAIKKRPRGPASFSASTSEHRGRMRIYRFAFADGAPGSFIYDPEARRAVVNPPPPFRGSGWFKQRRHRAKGRWRGTLKASFPGRAKVRLAGPSFAAKVSRFTVVQPGQRKRDWPSARRVVNSRPDATAGTNPFPRVIPPYPSTKRGNG